MATQIKDLKKDSKFRFNDTIYKVKQKFSKWKTNDDPYLLTNNGEIFYHGELEVEKIE